MSYKEVLKDKIKAMLSHNKDSTHKDIMNKSLDIIYSQALTESKKTGQSVASITYEILEAFEECHDKQDIQKRENHLIYASTVIVDIIYNNAQKSIEEKEKNLANAREELINTMESEMLHLLESLDTFQEYANDQSYAIYKKSLFHIKSDIINKVNKFKSLLIHYNN